MGILATPAAFLAAPLSKCLKTMMSEYPSTVLIVSAIASCELDTWKVQRCLEKTVMPLRGPTKSREDHRSKSVMPLRVPLWDGFILNGDTRSRVRSRISYWLSIQATMQMMDRKNHLQVKLVPHVDNLPIVSKGNYSPTLITTTPRCSRNGRKFVCTQIREQTSSRGLILLHICVITCLHLSHVVKECFTVVMTWIPVFYSFC